ncbi:MAG: DUF2721 domain-containing protein [Leptolyngbya sp. SIO4C5]|nr:DUF2721 domain-containing protein [Leptolyngbya sp. SIO4C5]
MTIAQTSQLIQLILNSVLMLVVCIGLLSGLRLRYNTVLQQLQNLQQQSWSRSQLGGSPSPLRGHRQRLQRQYRLASSSHLIMHYVGLLFVGSTFALAARTLLNLGWLIPLALFLFVLGTGGMLLSLSLALLDFYYALQRPLPRQPEAAPRLLPPRRRRSPRLLKSSQAAIPPLRVGDGS